MIEMRDYTFYVYELCFPDGGIFYVGKGSDDGSRTFRRAHAHWRKGQLVKTLIKAMEKRGEKPVTRIVFESASEADAFAEERRLISAYGRRFDGGALWNVADGGAGGTPRGMPLSAEHKKKIGLANRGKKRSQETKNKMRIAQSGMKHSSERIVKNANARRGKARSDETKARISAAKKGRPGPSHSEQTKLLMSESAKAGWAKRRAKLSA
jgi:hypothetical protein